MSAALLCTTTVLYAQDVVVQKDIKSSTQDILSQVTTTIDQQSQYYGKLQSVKKLTSENKQ